MGSIGTHASRRSGDQDTHISCFLESAINNAEILTTINIPLRETRTQGRVLQMVQADRTKKK